MMSALLRWWKLWGQHGGFAPVALSVRLNRACVRLDAAEVVRALSAGADPCCTDDSYETPLLRLLAQEPPTAARAVNQACALIALLDAGARMMAADAHGTRSYHVIQGRLPLCAQAYLAWERKRLPEEQVWQRVAVGLDDNANDVAWWRAADASELVLALEQACAPVERSDPSSRRL